MNEIEEDNFNEFDQINKNYHYLKKNKKNNNISTKH